MAWHVKHQRGIESDRTPIRNRASLNAKKDGLGATDGRAVMHVIRARGGHQAGGEWHRHSVQLQLVYVLKGWVRFEYEGQGEVTLRAGSCVHQPPGIRHREIEHSEDLELIEIVLPADFQTTAA
jgi:quercetin dioxygenase-like cupin family protein